MSSFFSRRNFLINSISATIFFSSCFLSKKTEAKSTLSKITDYFGENAASMSDGFSNSFGQWAEQVMQDFGQLKNTADASAADKMSKAYGGYADTLNTAAQARANALLKMETKPAPYARPSNGVAASTLLSAIAAMEKSIDETCDSLTAELKQLTLEIQAANVYEYKKTITERFGADGSNIYKDLDLAYFLTPSGYENADAIDHSSFFIHFQMGDLYSLIDVKHPESSCTLIARFMTVLRSLKMLQASRVRSSALYEGYKSAFPSAILNTNEEAILTTTLKGAESGLSIIDCIKFDVTRRWLNDNWHDKLEDATSETALNEELVEQMSFNNFLALRIFKMKEQTNILNGLFLLENLDQFRKSSEHQKAESVTL